MARDPDHWSGFPELQWAGHFARGVFRHRRLVFAAAAVTAAVWAVMADTRWSMVLAPVALAVAIWAFTDPRGLAVAAGLSRAPAVEIDPLRRVFTPPGRVLPPLPPPVEHLRAIPVGFMVGPDGQNLEPWLLRLWGTPILIGGIMGAGKSVLLWSILHGAAPWIAHGTVRVWALDPKGGMELGYRPELFTEFWCGQGETEKDYGEGAAELLEKACRELRKRTERARGETRTVTPSLEEPLIVIIIDEIAAFAYAVADPKLRGRIDRAIRFLASQGRAACVQLVGAIQDPRVETIGYRELFPQRIGLAMAHSHQPDLLFGQGAREAGALCDLIPDDEPGVGFIKERRGRAYRKVRALHVDDDAIDVLTRDYQPPGSS